MEKISVRDINFNELENVVIEIQTTSEPSYQKTGSHWLLEY